MGLIRSTPTLLEKNKKLSGTPLEATKMYSSLFNYSCYYLHSIHLGLFIIVPNILIIHTRYVLFLHCYENICALNMLCDCC